MWQHMIERRQDQLQPKPCEHKEGTTLEALQDESDSTVEEGTRSNCGGVVIQCVVFVKGSLSLPGGCHRDHHEVAEVSMGQSTSPDST